MNDNHLPPPSGAPLNHTPDEVIPAALEQQLRRAAASSPVVADWDDLAGRVRRSNRRRVQALSGVLGLVAVAGPVIGFAVGRGGNAGGDRVVAGAPNRQSTNGDGPPTSGFAVPAPYPNGRVIASPATATAAGGTDGVTLDSNGQAPAGPPVYTKLFVEKIGQYTVRVFKTDEGWMRGKLDGFGPGFNPPADCFPTGQIMVEVSDDNMVAQSGIQIGGSPPWGGGPGITASPIGVQEGAPAWLTVGSVPTGVTSAKVTTPTGTVDALVRDGIMIALQPAPGLTFNEMGPGWDKVTIDTGTGPKNLMELQQITRRKECEPPPPPPPPLPAAGKNQPADPAAARTAIVDSMHKLVDGDVSIESRNAIIEGRKDSDTDVRTQMADGPYGDVAKTARASLIDLVFIDKDRAVALVNVELSVTTISNQFVEFHLTGGVWKATRPSWCQMAQMTGAMCTDVNYEDFPGSKYGGGSDGVPMATVAVGGGYPTTAVAATIAPPVKK